MSCRWLLYLSVCTCFTEPEFGLGTKLVEEASFLLLFLIPPECDRYERLLDATKSQYYQSLQKLTAHSSRVMGRALTSDGNMSL